MDNAVTNDGVNTKWATDRRQLLREQNRALQGAWKPECFCVVEEGMTLNMFSLIVMVLHTILSIILHVGTVF